MALRHVTQPPDSHLCGQACVSMATGSDLVTVVAVLGKGATSEHDLRSGLMTLGHVLGDFVAHRTARVPIADLPVLPKLDIAIARLRRPNGLGYHWILIHDGLVFDPLFAEPKPIREYEAINHRRTYYVASFALVYRVGPGR